jgi:hypothetical protein
MNTRYPYCTAVQQILDDSTFNEPEDYEGDLGLVIAAYECDHGCVNEQVWDLEDLEGSIGRKFRYAIQGILRVLGLGYETTDYSLVIEPTHTDRSYFVARTTDGHVLIDDSYKAWAFGATGLDALEAFFAEVADNVNMPPDPENLVPVPVKITEWIKGGLHDMEDLCTDNEDVVQVAGRCLDNANAQDLVGDILFKGEDGKYYEGFVTFTLVEVNEEDSRKIAQGIER